MCFGAFSSPVVVGFLFYISASKWARTKSTTCPVIWRGESVSYVRVQATGKCPEIHNPRCVTKTYILAIVGRPSALVVRKEKKGFRMFFTIIIDVYRSRAYSGRSMEYDDEAAALLFYYLEKRDFFFFLFYFFMFLWWRVLLFLFSCEGVLAVVCRTTTSSSSPFFKPPYS